MVMTLDSSDQIDKQKQYPLRVGERLYKRIDEHVFFLKSQSRRQSKQKWITEAIQEKLEKEKRTRLPKIPRTKSISIKIESSVSKELEEKVDFLKKMKGSHTLKNWLIDAIEEKLESESYLVEKAVRSIREDPHE